jgi:hypothetical protein
VRLARSEQDAVGNDDSGATAGLEQLEEQRDEEQLGLFGLDDLQQVLRRVLVVEAARKRRIRPDQRVGLFVGRVLLG